MGTVKDLITAQAFIRIITFHREGDGFLLEARPVVYLNNQNSLFYRFSTIAAVGTFVPG